MKKISLGRLILPPGPILSFALLGLMMLSGVLYYRAVKIQRFLEPALALTQPRTEFGEGIGEILRSVFTPESAQGISYATGTIGIEDSLLFDSAGLIRSDSRQVIRRLGSAILKVMSDGYIQSHIELVLISSHYTISNDARRNLDMRRRAQRKSELLLSALYGIEPQLEKKYGIFFVPGAVPSDPTKEKDSAILEIRIIPSERLHIDVLQRLRKYAP